MKKTVFRTLVKYLIAALVGAGMVLAMLALRDFGAGMTALERAKMLADAFTVPGVVLVLFAALVWLSNEGAFWGLTYLASRVVKALVPMGRTFEKHETYRDYVEKKREKGGVKGYAFILWVGLVFFAAAVFFTIRFYVI